MTKVRPIHPFLKPVDYTETTIFLVMKEGCEGDPNCTSTSDASADIMPANISVVKLSHVSKTSIKEIGNTCLTLK